jgi:hypothetical protein
MAVSRPFLLALLAAVLLGATVLASTGARQHAGEPTAAKHRTPATAATGSQPARPAASPVKSGRFRFRLAFFGLADRGGKVRERQAITATGAFQGRGATRVPRFDIDVQVRSDAGRLRTGAISLGSRGFLSKGDTAYALPPALWSRLSAARPQIAGYAARGARASGTGRPALLGFDSGPWLPGLHRSGSATVDGVDSVHLVSRVDAERMLRDIGGSGSRAGGVVPGLDPATAKRVARVVRNARADLYVGKRDGVLRRLRMRANLEDPGAKGARAGDFRHGRAEISFDLTAANRSQRIAAPKRVSKAPPSVLGRSTGIFASGALGVGVVAIDQPGLAGARRAGYRFDRAAPPRSAARARGGRMAAAGLPRRVTRALERRKVVVLFFFQPGASDDAATAGSVRGLRKRKSVAVFSDRIKDVGRYGPLVGGVGVSQAPSIVIIGRDRRARLLQGFVDAKTLAQEISDAR